MLAVKSLNPGDDQDRTVVAVVQRWAQKSPAAVAAWVAQFPDTPVRTAATENLIAVWTSKDSEAANHWVQSLPESSLRRDGLAAYANAMRGRAVN
jgi:hypothetical protein